MVGGAALDGEGDDLPGLGVGLVLEAGLDFLDLHGRLVGHVVLQLLEQKVSGLLGGKAGDALQLGDLLLLQLLRLGLGGVQLGQLGGQLLFLLLNVLGLAVQVLLLLLKAVFLALELGAAVLDLLLVLVLGLEDLLLGLYQGLALFALGALIGLVDNTGGLVLGGFDLPLRCDLPAVPAKDRSAQSAHGQRGDHTDNC